MPAGDATIVAVACFDWISSSSFSRMIPSAHAITSLMSTGGVSINELHILVPGNTPSRNAKDAVWESHSSRVDIASVNLVM